MYDPEFDKLMTFKKTADQLERIADQLENIAGALEKIGKVPLTPDNQAENIPDPEEYRKNEWLLYRND